MAPIQRRPFQVGALARARMRAQIAAAKNEVLLRKIEVLTRDLNIERAGREAEKVAREKAEKLSTIDPLTGILNRRGCKENVEKLCRSILRANRDSPDHPQILVVMAFDIDHFKTVNDTFGHGKGDEVIKDVAAQAVAAQTTQTFKRPYDIVALDTENHNIVAREGGEEFIVAFSCETSKSRYIAEEMGEKLRTAIEINCVIPLDIPCDSPGHIVTVSIGVGFSTPDEGIKSFERAKKDADSALYEAKRGGRNRVHLNLNGLSTSKAEPNTARPKKPNPGSSDSLSVPPLTPD